MKGFHRFPQVSAMRHRAEVPLGADSRQTAYSARRILQPASESNKTSPSPSTKAAPPTGTRSPPPATSSIPPSSTACPAPISSKKSIQT